MCGIVGVVVKADNGLIKQTEESFYQMLYTDVLRGEDSTGVIGVEKSSKFHIMKEANEAAWVIPQIKSDEIGKSMYNTGKAFIGHNRKQTSGAVTDQNAHPFVVNDSFAMVHNGTLYGHKLLAETDVDSEALAIHLEKAFREEDYIKALEGALAKVYGAYALAIYDQVRHQVHLLRNEDRPLALLETDNAWYFASEGLMAGWILNRNGYDYSKIKMQLLPKHELHTFDLDTNAHTVRALNVKKYQAPVVTTTGAAWHHGSTTQSGVASTPPTSSVDVSKNAFKSFKKVWEGKYVRFWCDDFVEADARSSIENGATEIILFGQNDEWSQQHQITADVDIGALKLRYPEQIKDRIWMGKVEEMVYDPKSRSVLINLEKHSAKPVAHSLPNQEPVSNVIALPGPVTNEEARKRLIERLRDTMYAQLLKEYRDKKDVLSAKELAIYHMVINQKERALGTTSALLLGAGTKTQTYYGVKEVYRELGETLVEHFDDTKKVHQLLDGRGHIVYETTTLLNA